MSLTSLPFALFVIISAIIYFIFPLKNYRWVILLAASGFFYVYNSFQYSAFIVVSIITVYLAALRIDAINAGTKALLKSKKEEWSREERKAYKEKSDNRRKCILAACLVFNFGILFMLKYFNFLSESIASMTGGAAESAPHIRLLLPLGISFYTFISTGYLIDVYRETASPEKNIFKFALFVSFFPHIVQGPISSFTKLHDQLITPHDLNWLNFKQGIMNIFWGLFKKLVVADTAWIAIKAYYANGGINGSEGFKAYGGTMVLFICLLYFTQINDLTIDAEGIGRSSLSDKNSIFNCVFCFKQESTRHQIKQCIFIKVLIHLEAKLIAKTALEQSFRNSVFRTRGVFENVRFVNNYYGLWVDDVPELVLSHCDFNRNRFALSVRGGKVISLDSKIYNNVYGLFLEAGGDFQGDLALIKGNLESDVRKESEELAGSRKRVSRSVWQRIETGF